MIHTARPATHDPSHNPHTNHARSEEVEHRLFMHPELFQPAAWFKGHRDRYHDGQVGLGYPNDFPEILYPVVNAARDTGLDPDMEQPDYCL